MQLTYADLLNDLPLETVFVFGGKKSSNSFGYMPSSQRVS